MPQTISGVTCADTYTDAATIGPIYESNGGYFIIAAQDVFMQLGYQQGGTRDFIWTPEVHVPLGNGVLYKGTVTARFRNYTAGSNATVSGALYYKTQPLFTIAAGGVATPSTATGVITGIIPAAGTTPTAGTGFTYTHTNGSGLYVFTFTNAFANAPVVVASPTSNSANQIVTVGSVTKNGFTVATYAPPTGLADEPFNFLAYPVS